MTLSIRLAIAGLGGLLVYASYEPIGWFLAGIVGITLLYVSLAPWNLRGPAKKRKKTDPVTLREQLATGPTVAQGMLLGFVHGLVQYLLLLPWIGEFVGNLPYIALAVVMALYSIALGAAGVAVARWQKWGVFLFPLAYVAVEYLRSNWPFGGFAWVRLAWGQVNGPLANLTALGGPALVTTATVLVAVGVGVAIIGRTRLAGLGVAALIMVIGMVSSFYVDREGTSSETIEVAAVQGNVPRMGLEFNAQRRAVLANHVRETRNLDSQVDLVIWPENSSDVNPFTDVEASTLITSAVESAQAPILVGTITRDEVGSRNTMIVFDPETGAGEYHNKKYLQPFGEYMPYRDFFRMFSPWVDAAGNFQPGDGTGTVSMDAAKLGRAVVVGIQTCYEVIFDQAGRDAIAAGAEFLATPTNNATFGFTDMTYQQLAMSRMRAIEFDRAVVVSATSGVSAIVTPDGQVEQSTRIFEAATLTADIPLKQTITLAARVGFYVEMVLVIIGSLAGIAALWFNARSRTTTSGRKDAKPHPKKAAAGKSAQRGAPVRASARRA
ncbi:Apolipoprotein N-acyltransferase [Corynebacterium faecale]|uniref:apolipoprotein N-acyltransferase n=1 Tax=Corynebacterium faecale TaxID=1758466 RepID=UPI0025B4CD66|nr:apolipoprotein N-acyltransferase [Corynebacterium faecale]WJY92249.1 Apolipoprotein N-acyltransferase [Corynebacterium faecale]